MDKLVFLEDDTCVIWATEDGRDSCRGCVVLQDGTVGHGAMHATEDQMLEAFALYRKHTGKTAQCAKTWIQFDPTNHPPPGDYWCEVPALKLRDGGCLCRALHWTGERWEGPGGEYEVGRFVPEMLPQLHGRGVARAGGYLFRYVQEETVLRDCGQRGACRTPPGCARHWEERNRELVRENEVLRSNSDHLSSENASLARQVEAMAMRIESLAEELAKPEDVRLRDVTDAMVGRAVMFDDIAARVRHELHELDHWIERAGNAERELAEVRRMHSRPHDSLCRDHMHTRTLDEHDCALEVIAELLKQNSIQEGSRNEQVSMVRTMQELPK